MNSKYDEWDRVADKWEGQDNNIAEPDKLDIIAQKLDKIIELLTPKPLTISPPITNEISEENKEKIKDTLMKLSKQGRLYR